MRFLLSSALPVMEGTKAMMLQPKKCLSRCAQMGYAVSVVYQTAGG